MLVNWNLAESKLTFRPKEFEWTSCKARGKSAHLAFISYQEVIPLYVLLKWRALIKLSFWVELSFAVHIYIYFHFNHKSSMSYDGIWSSGTTILCEFSNRKRDWGWQTWFCFLLGCSVSKVPQRELFSSYQGIEPWNFKQVAFVVAQASLISTYLLMTLICFIDTETLYCPLNQRNAAQRKHTTLTWMLLASRRA